MARTDSFRKHHEERPNTCLQIGASAGARRLDDLRKRRDFESNWAHVFTVVDGRIAAFREFMDSHVAVEAFGCYPLAAGVETGNPAAH